MMLAQQTLDALPANFWKSFCIALFAIIGLILAVVTIWALTRKPPKVEISDNPSPEFRKAPKRYNHDLSEQRYGEQTRRLDGHDAEIEQLWTTMRSEDAAIRRENGAKFDAILISLGEIKGELKNK